MRTRDKMTRSIAGWVAFILMALGTVSLVVGVITRERGFGTAVILFVLGLAVFFFFLFRGESERYDVPASQVDENA